MYTNEIGFVFKNLELSDKTIKILNKLNQLKSTYNISLFLCDRKENFFCDLPKFYITAAFDFRGLLVSNDYFTASKLLEYPNPNVLYCMWEDKPLKLRSITALSQLSTKYNIPLLESLEYERFF